MAAVGDKLLWFFQQKYQYEKNISLQVTEFLE